MLVNVGSLCERERDGRGKGNVKVFCERDESLSGRVTQWLDPDFGFHEIRGGGELKIATSYFFELKSSFIYKQRFSYRPSS